MNTTIEYGEYGQKMVGGTSSQIMLVHSGAYLVSYTFERWSDVLGTLEILDIQQLADEFGMGHVSREPVSDGWMRIEVEKAFKELMHQTVKYAMGIY